jgi:hypothetical protein
MESLYKESESNLKIFVASIKTALKKREMPAMEKFEIKNLNSKINE